MKKLFILPLFLVLFLAGCKDNEDDVSPEKFQVTEDLKGNWSNNFRTTEFYSDTDQLMRRDTATVDVRFEFDGNRMHITNPGVNGVETFTYVVPDTSKTNYIVISKDGAVANTYEITTINESKMVWKQVIDYAGYPDGNGGYITSRRGINLYEFVKL